MEYKTSTNNQTYCFNEYDPLVKVIVCEPQFMAIQHIINETQKYYQDEGIRIDLAMKQHRKLQQTLRDHHIEVILLPNYKKYPEQVFTRDIGFTLGDTIFLANLATQVRQGEENVLKEWLHRKKISYSSIINGTMEGGDVIIDQDTIFIGLSKRTNQQAVNELQRLLPNFTIIPLPIKENFLHLDCVFNVIAPNKAIIFKEAFSKKNLDLLASRYDFIEVPKEEQFTIGTNVLSIGNQKIISLPTNKKVNKQLQEKGFEPILVDFSEIIKSGGSFRCCTLPLLRKK